MISDFTQLLSLVAKSVSLCYTCLALIPDRRWVGKGKIMMNIDMEIRVLFRQLTLSEKKNALIWLESMLEAEREEVVSAQK